MEGKANHLLLLLLLFFFLLSFVPLSLGQSSGYNCSADRSIYPCQAYAFYRTGQDPGGPLDLVSVGDLFGVSRLMVARSSNLSVTARLRSGQPLLIPLDCSCDPRTNRSYFPVAYQILAGDTYYAVSSYKFDNLTAYPAVILVNPTLVPTDLQIGTIVTFPIFCQCPNASITNTTTGANASGLVTYVVQPSDSYSSIASSFGSTVQSLISLNGPESQIQPFTTILVPLAQDPPPILLSNNSSSVTPASPPPSSPPPLVRRTEKKGVVVGLAIGLGLVGVLWIASLLMLLARRDRRRGEADGKVSSGGWTRESSKGGEKKLRRWESDERLMDITEWLDKYKVYRIEELRQATADFDRSHLIQGSVYKGSIDGEVVAIKKMKWNARDELKILQKVNHTNLVKLEGFCIDSESGTCYLIYEYVENGSLSSWLGDRSLARKLDWRARLRIALDIAQGLQYVHEHTWPRVVHKDIKSSNVLLDAHLRAKIANFGLAKSGCNAVTTHIVGTQGYIAPEYLSDGLVTTKMDVFAYGVVLLELVMGREAVSDEGEMLWVEAEGIFGGGGGGDDERSMEARIGEWIDPALKEQSFSAESVVGVVNIARACLDKDPSKRPSMVDVAYTLSKAEEVYSDGYGDGVAVGSADVMGR